MSLTKVAVLIIVGMAVLVLFARSPSVPPVVPRSDQEQRAVLVDFAAMQAAAKRARVDAYEKDRATINGRLRQLNAAGKWDEAYKFARPYDDVGDPEFQKLYAVADAKLTAKTIAEAKASARKEGVLIGMTKERVLASVWGKPQSINRTVHASGVHEQWVYGGHNYLYFDGEVLTAIQN